MTKLLAEAIAIVRRLPPEAQDEIARAMPAQGAPQEIPPEDLPAVLEGLEAKAKMFATDEEVEAAFRRFE